MVMHTFLGDVNECSDVPTDNVWAQLYGPLLQHCDTARQRLANDNIIIQVSCHSSTYMFCIYILCQPSIEWSVFLLFSCFVE